jgi:hypothetical protein
MSSLIEKQRELERHISAISDDRMPGLVEHAEQCVRAIQPDAKLMFTTNRRGDVVSVGVYAVTLFLNENGQFRPIEQPAPQLISNREEYRNSYTERAKQRQCFNVWADAYARLIALENIR